MAIDTIFFDAGFTLVFPDMKLTLAPLLDMRVAPSEEQLFDAERFSKRLLDEAHSHGDFGVDARYWQSFYARLLTQMNIDASPDLLNDLASATRRGVNWRVVRPGTLETLRRLRSRYRLAVISNSDGSIARLLEELGLASCFESITDSHICGCEKPDPRIFRAAMHSIDVQAGQSMYVGDVYSVDFLGARAVGMSALLMDAAGVYADTNYPRVDSLEQIEPYVASLESS